MLLLLVVSILYIDHVRAWMPSNLHYSTLYRPSLSLSRHSLNQLATSRYTSRLYEKQGNREPDSNNSNNNSNNNNKQSDSDSNEKSDINAWDSFWDQSYFDPTKVPPSSPLYKLAQWVQRDYETAEAVLTAGFFVILIVIAQEVVRYNLYPERYL
jgi:hypothetical protein